MPRKKVILSAGGTGGHLYPAQAAAEKLLDSHELLFVAGGLGTCKYFDRSRFAFEEIPTATFSFSKPFQMLQAGWTIFCGFCKSWRILGKFSPDLVVGFGNYYTLPLLLAARVRCIPILLHEQNTIPGKVNRLFSPCARVTAITFPESARFLKGTVTRVFFPMKLREEALDSWAYYGLDRSKPTLLIYGGSQGAEHLNTLAAESAEKWSRFQILHFTGHAKDLESVKARYEVLGITCCVKPFEEQMAHALNVADLAITRAGAGTIAELISHELPALLIPFPHASENHQMSNGTHFVKCVKGGEMCLESELSVEKLVSAIESLEQDLENKKQNIHVYKHSQRMQSLSTLIQETLDELTN